MLVWILSQGNHYEGGRTITVFTDEHRGLDAYGKMVDASLRGIKENEEWEDQFYKDRPDYLSKIHERRHNKPVREFAYDDGSGRELTDSYHNYIMLKRWECV